MYNPDRLISFANIHKMNNRAIPEAIMSYKIAVQLQKLYNANDQSLDWIGLNLNQILTTKQTFFFISKSNSAKVGLNILANRLSVLNGRIPLAWLNDPMNTFRLVVKRCFQGSWRFNRHQPLQMCPRFSGNVQSRGHKAIMG